MGYLIIESREGSGYDDSNDHYEFPARYCAQFDQALQGDEAIALIYEPRRGGGRMAFVAWTRIQRGPQPVAGKPRFYRVEYVGGLRSFDQAVPFSIGGVPVEHRLRQMEPQRWGPSSQGKAVRSISEGNAIEILALGNATHLRIRMYSHPDSSLDPKQRGRRIVEQIERDVRFRDRVLSSYRFRCAVSGLGAGPAPASRLHGMLDAAHIRSVAENGPDDPSNGIAMTPTLHRLFDAGLFTLVPRRNSVVVERSPQLCESLLSSGRARIELANGMEVSLPDTETSIPRNEFLKFHRENVYLRTA